MSAPTISPVDALAALRPYIHDAREFDRLRRRVSQGRLELEGRPVVVPAARQVNGATRVLRVLQLSIDGWTASEIAVESGLTAVEVRRRLVDLRKLELAFAAGRRFVVADGGARRGEKIWRATARGILTESVSLAGLHQ